MPKLYKLVLSQKGQTTELTLNEMARKYTLILYKEHCAETRTAQLV